MRTKQLEIAVNLFGERADAYHAAIQAQDREQSAAIVGGLLSELEANAILLSEKDFALHKSHNRIKEEDSDDEDNDVPRVVTSNPYNGYELQLLHIAAAYGFIEIVQYIIADIQQRHQKTNFRGEVTQKPIGHLLDCRDEFGLTPLHVATVFKRWVIADLLLAHGANPLAAAYQDWFWPESGNTIETVLLRHGQPGEPNPQNFNNSWTMLAYIILGIQQIDKGREAALDRLLTLSQRNKPVVSNDDQDERKDAAEKLLMRYLVSNRGANLNRIYIFGEHPNTEFVRWIDGDGNTLLHWAVIYNRIDIATYLLGRGANLDEENIDFETPLSLAIVRKNLKFLKLFFENGLDPNQKYERTSYSLGDYIVEYLQPPKNSPALEDYNWIATFVEEKYAENTNQFSSIDDITAGFGNLASGSIPESDEDDSDSEETATFRGLVKKHNTGKQRLQKGLGFRSDDLRTSVLRRSGIFAAAALAAASKVAELSQNGELLSPTDLTAMPPSPRSERKRLPEENSEQLAKSMGSENTAIAVKQARLFSSDGVTDNLTEQATAGQALSNQVEAVATQQLPSETSFDFESARNVQM